MDKDLSYLMNNEKHYITTNNYLKDYYGCKVYKISLNGPFTCPNRDGTVSTGGCLFCSEKASGDFAGDKDKSFKDQFIEIKDMMKEKWEEGKYIAYLQSYSNTYGSIDKLTNIYNEIINLDKDIVIFDVATRPDCINEDVCILLSNINKIKRVWVELGFQSSNDKTKKLLNIGYNNECFIKAVKLLQKYNLEIIVHIINGLPNETKDDMINTVKFINNLNVDGIKIHMLHIMKNTLLEKYYESNPFHILTLDEYKEIVSEQLRYINTKAIIHRITGDAPKNLLITPLWTLKKFVCMDEIDKYMRLNNIYQGDKLKEN